MATQPAPTRYTLEAFHGLAKPGQLDEQPRVPIAGTAVPTSPAGLGHKACNRQLTHRLVSSFLNTALVGVQNPWVGGLHARVPEMVFWLPTPTHHAAASHTPRVSEVADTALQSATSVKLPLYAQHGLPEVWAVDLQEQQLLVGQHSGDADCLEEQVKSGRSTLELPTLGLNGSLEVILGSEPA